MIILFCFILTIFSKDCSTYNNCKDCINDPHCGWYSPTGPHPNFDFKCVEGTEFNCKQPECSKPHLYYKDFCPRDLDFPILNRRSIRKYLPIEISRDVILKIVTNGIWAPSCKDYQPWKFYVVEDKEILKNISEHVEPGQDIWYGSSVVIFIFIKPTDEECEHFAFTDAGLALMNMELATYNLGLATCSIGCCHSAEDLIRTLVKAAKDEIFVLAVTIGYPNEKQTHTRKDPDIVWVK